MLKLNEFRMRGSAADVEMTGEADLAHETQDLRVRVVPSLGDSAAIGIALVNPVAGVAAAIAQRMLKNPLGQIFAFDYAVSGSWSDPKVVKILPPPPPDDRSGGSEPAFGPWRIAAIQMVSGPEVAPNLAAAERLIAAAAAAGARLAALPENFYLIGRHEGDKVEVREPEGAGPIQDFLSSTAKKHRLWIVGGTAPISTDDEKRIRGACLVYDDSGKRVARYDKMHLFRFDNETERYDEARTLQPAPGRSRSRARSGASRFRFATMCASPSSTAGSASST